MKRSQLRGLTDDCISRLRSSFPMGMLAYNKDSHSSATNWKVVITIKHEIIESEYMYQEPSKRLRGIAMNSSTIPYFPASLDIFVMWNVCVE